MPTISKKIKGTAYNEETSILAFRHNNCRVIIKPDEITIKDINNKEEAHEIMEYLKNIIAGVN